MKKLSHLSEIYNSYDTFIIDLWGVMHNGIKLNKGAVEVVEKLNKYKKKIVFLSNAPRPSKQVVNFLKKMKFNEKFLNNVLTSGEAAIESIKSNKFGKSFFHLGPQRDESLFEDSKKNKTSIKDCDFILCTGLLEGHENDLKYYNGLLAEHVTKKFVCTNPDLVVHRGNISEHCAGAVAEIFKSLGGEVIYFGKPHKEIYEIFLKKNEKVLAIGDNLKTDIKGANNLNIDSLFITNGIHKAEIQYDEELNNLLKSYNVNTKYFQEDLNW